MYEKLIAELREYWNDGTEEIRGEAADAIEQLQTEWKAEAESVTLLLKEIPRWIPVTERLPLLNTPVLATDGIEIDISWMYGVPPRWITSYTAIDEDKLTHWMPLPQTPKGEAE